MNFSNKEKEAMVKSLNVFIYEMSNFLEKKIKDFPIKDIIKLWNEFAVDKEQRYNDCVFNINSKSDIIDLLNNQSFSTIMLLKIGEKCQKNQSDYFMYSHNDKLYTILSYENIIQLVLGHINDLSEFIVKYPNFEASSIFYNRFLEMLEN